MHRLLPLFCFTIPRGDIQQKKIIKVQDDPNFIHILTKCSTGPNVFFRSKWQGLEL